MTAVQYKTMKVYLADFSKCSTKAAFYRILALTFGLKLSVLALGGNMFWRAMCENIARISISCIPVKVRISGLETVYSFFPDGVEKFLRVLRAAEENYPLFSADIKIGDAVWHCR